MFRKQKLANLVPVFGVSHGPNQVARAPKSQHFRFLSCSIGVSPSAESAALDARPMNAIGVLT
jgi:hypothetical protein